MQSCSSLHHAFDALVGSFTISPKLAYDFPSALWPAMNNTNLQSNVPCRRVCCTAVKPALLSKPRA